MAALYAIVNPSTVVINLTQWDGVTPFNVSPNTLVAATNQPNAQIGGTYSGGVFTAPAAPAAAQGIIFQNSPISGATLNLPNAPQPQAKLYCYLQPAATLAALTLTLPPSPQDGDMSTVMATKAITALTITPGVGSTLLNFTSPIALSAGVSQTITFSAQLGGWFHQ
jgi:hypothetical protein